jgi:hypothetical protein
MSRWPSPCVSNVRYFPMFFSSYAFFSSDCSTCFHGSYLPSMNDAQEAAKLRLKLKLKVKVSAFYIATLIERSVTSTALDVSRLRVKLSLYMQHKHFPLPSAFRLMSPRCACQHSWYVTSHLVINATFNQACI